MTTSFDSTSTSSVAPQVSTADLYDEHGDTLQSVTTQFISFGGRTSFHGPARTLRSYEDNLLLKELVASDGAGGVLVVDGGGSLRCALLGDNMARRALDNGWSGLVILGAVRDRDQLARLDIGVKALGTNPRRSRKKGEGTVDDVVTIGEAEIRPGAHLYCDTDGILVER
ncbi:ribonuclease E activity regulator RraA [Promicromonospora alba]|uniref:4-hydroxy-4-methyl-2-oxoglutarate aldolase n=1 Tax=Promicromonospora alba TaxID=1616110 RepID=A0ABV9HMF2_9MICO